MSPCYNMIMVIFAGLMHLPGVKVSSVLFSFGPWHLQTYIKALNMGAKSSGCDKVYVENMQIIFMKKFPFLYQ